MGGPGSVTRRISTPVSVSTAVGRDGLVGEQLGGQPGPAQPGRHRPPPRATGPHTPTRRGMRARRAPTSVARASSESKSMDVERPVLESGGGRFSADHDEHVHMASLL